jgi:hypothetical protein
MPLRARVGKHTKDGGRQCQNWADDQKTVIDLLNRIPVASGGAGASLKPRIVGGVASNELYAAIVAFETKAFPGQQIGFVEPGGAMLKRMEELAAPAARAPAVPPPIAKATPAKKKETEFHPGVMHNHQPSGRWADVQKNPDSPGIIGWTCSNFAPENVLRLASTRTLYDKPLAAAHLRWFFDGNGRDFVENKNLELMLRTDAKVQAKIVKKIPKDRSSGTFVDQVTITQDDYSDEDFQYSFGEIDRLDFEVDFDAGTLHAWFQDRYEWHPVYPFYRNMPGDYKRETNCIHAAGVELKSGRARDYWMKGEVTIPLKAIQSAASRNDPWRDPLIITGA